MATPTYIRGAVAYLFAFDLAYDADITRLTSATLLGAPITTFALTAGTRAPRELFFYRPKMVTLKPIELAVPGGGVVSVERTVKVFAVGAASIVYRVPFEVASLIDLVPWHDAVFREVKLHDEARRLAEQLCAELGDVLIKPARPLRDEEAYTVFCIDTASVANRHAAGQDAPDVESFLDHGRRKVASLLMQEADENTLSDQEVLDTTNRYLAYGKDDLTVIDWDAALLIDKPAAFASTLHIMELANVQLAEVEAIDRILDESLASSYRDIANVPFYKKSSVLSKLRELRIDVTRLSDETSNTSKFFGDWHLARIYQSLAGRFHLSDWHHAIDEKLKTLDDLYQLLRQDQVNRWLIGLEIAVVVLFVIEVVKALW
jgi:hypothetical protein